MSSDSAPIRDFARRLIVLERARDESIETAVGGAIGVCDRLRAPLAKLAGIAGYRSLISRATAMAKVEVPILDAVQVAEDGSLEGLDGSGIGQVMGGEPGVVVVTQLLVLLVTFIGEPLTGRIIQDVWPDAPPLGVDTERGVIA